MEETQGQTPDQAAGQGHGKQAYIPAGTQASMRNVRDTHAHRAARANASDPDRTLRLRLRKSRERRRRAFPLEDDLTAIYIADITDPLESLGPPLDTLSGMA